MRSEVRWERMFPDELDAAFARCPLAWLTYGLCEPHGPHNALGLDGLKAHALACAAARAHGGIVAPPEYWHIHEIGRFAASTCVRKFGESRRMWLTAVTMREVFPRLEIIVQQVAGWPPPAATSRWMLNWKIVPPQAGCL